MMTIKQSTILKENNISSIQSDLTTKINQTKTGKKDNRASVEEDDIAVIVALWTGIPVSKVSRSETERLLDMENILHQRVIGQEEAVSAIAKAIRRARVGLQNPNRPIASFLFSGPTGVGKTELTKTLASYFFGSEQAMVRLDMSEYMEKHTAAKLIGAPPGYIGYNEGGQLTEAVRRKPYSLVLFDEVEKGHPDIFNLLLQILEDGRLSDSKGRVVSFKNTILILTSNLGSESIHDEIQKPSDSKLEKDIGYDGSLEMEKIIQETQYKKLSTAVNQAIQKFFRPEFINRIDEVIIFKPLTKDDIGKIADLMIKDLVNRVKEHAITLTITEKVKKMLIEQGYSPIFGARPLRRIMTKLVEDEIALKFLQDLPQQEVKISVDLDYRDKVVIFIEELTTTPVIEEEVKPIRRTNKKDLLDPIRRRLKLERFSKQTKPFYLKN